MNDPRFLSIQFTPFTILAQGTHVRIDPRVAFPSWYRMLAEIAQMPRQTPVSLRAAYQIDVRLREERSRLGPVIIPTLDFNDLISAAGFHIELRTEEFVLSPDPDPFLHDDPDARVFLKALRTWLTTEPDDAIAKVTLERYAEVIDLVRDLSR